jgi:hypothetical protein
METIVSGALAHADSGLRAIEDTCSVSTNAPMVPRMPMASVAMADLWAKLNHRCEGKDSRITIEHQCERHCNLEGRNLEDFGSLAPM